MGFVLQPLRHAPEEEPFRKECLFMKKSMLFVLLGVVLVAGVASACPPACCAPACCAPVVCKPVKVIVPVCAPVCCPASVCCVKPVCCAPVVCKPRVVYSCPTVACCGGAWLDDWCR